MKKNYFLLTILVIIGMSTYAQPILTAADFATNYSASLYDASATGLTPGNAGPNQVWDFSTLPTTLSGTMSTEPIATTPFTSNFPTANYCLKSVGTDNTTSYGFYNLSSTSFERVGSVYNNTPNGIVGSVKLLQFPSTYNSVFNSTYQLSEDPSFTYTETRTYDAYGTLKTPFGTYTNVIRQKTVYLNGTNSNTSYAWFSVNPFNVIMEGDFETNGYLEFYKNTTGLSINEANKEKGISIYPNPTKAILNLQIPNKISIDKVIITDMTGKTVLEQALNTNQIDVERLSKGMYILQAFSGKEKFISKFVKE